MAEVLAEVMAKGAKAERGAGRVSWLTASHRVLRATGEALEFGDWRLPWTEVYEAELAAGRGDPLAPRWVLSVRHKGAQYRFGFDREPSWLAALPVQVRGLAPPRRRVYPLVSLAIRLLFVAVLAWWVVRSCGAL